MSLYLKYRPLTLNKVQGNKSVTSVLENMLRDKVNCPHAFLLYGPTGCGKTTIARIIAKELGCVGEDLVEVDSADFRGIDTIREVRRNSQFLPIEGEVRVWIIDECHKMTNDAQNALLKILEDTPPHVYFVLCTTEPQKIIATIKSRCQQFQMTPLEHDEMYRLLIRISKREKANVEEAHLEKIIDVSKGLPRSAIQILEQVINMPVEERKLFVDNIEFESSQAIDLCRKLINKNSSWKELANILSGLKDQDSENIRRSVLGYCQAILLSGKDEPLYGLIMEEFTKPFYDSGFSQLVYACYSVFKNK